MANIINTSLTWSQEDAAKYFLQPLFISNNDLSHFDVMTNISGSSILLDKYSALKDVTKAINDECFEADDTRSANSNVTLSLVRLEVEHKQKAHALFNHIKSQLMKQGIPAGQVVADTGVALTDLNSLMTARTNELAASDQVMFVSRAFADNYRAELTAKGVQGAYQDLQGGIANLSFNGIPMIVMPEFDVNIAAYGATLPSAGPSGTGATRYAMLVAKDAIAVGTDWSIQDVDMWYNRDCKENRFRMNYSFGCALKDDSLVATIVG